MGVMETKCPICKEWFYPTEPGNLCGGKRCYEVRNSKQQYNLGQRIGWAVVRTFGGN